MHRILVRKLEIDDFHLDWFSHRASSSTPKYNPLIPLSQNASWQGKSDPDRSAVHFATNRCAQTELKVVTT